MGCLKIVLPDGRKVGLAFSYPLIPVRRKRESRRAVHARINILEEKDGKLIQTEPPLAEAVSICSRSDNFNKETGRKNALTAALTARNGSGERVLSPAITKVIWEAWRGRPRPVSTPKVPVPQTQVTGAEVI